MKWTNGDPVSYQLWTNSMYGQNHGSSYRRQHSAFHHLLPFVWGDWFSPHITFAENLDPYKRTPNTSVWIPHFCTGMLLLNLASPEWVSTDCNKARTIDIICQQNMTNSLLCTPQNFTATCPRGYVSAKDFCVNFIWVNSSHNNPKLYSCSCSGCDNTKTLLQFIKQIHFIFEAVGEPFPPLLSCTNSCTVSFNRQFYKYIVVEHEKNQTVKGF